MKPEAAMCVVRVRLAALREMSAAGGLLRPGQLSRAIAPVLGRIAADVVGRTFCGGAVVSGRVECGRKGEAASGVSSAPF